MALSPAIASSGQLIAPSPSIAETASTGSA